MYCMMRLIANYISLNIEFQNLSALKVALKVIIYMNRPNSDRCTGKDNISRFKCKKLTDKTNQFIHAMYHIASKSTLHGLSVYIQMKMQILHIAHCSKRQPFTHYSTSIKAFACHNTDGQTVREYFGPND